MKKALLLSIIFSTIAACGYKGDLYLPKEGDKTRFGVFQIGIPDSDQPAAASQPEQPLTHTPQQHEQSAQ